MKRIKVLVLVLAFAFAAMGGAYAMWYDSLFLDENVTTGIVDLSWCPVSSTSDSGANYTGYPNLGPAAVFAGEKDRLDPGNPNDAKNIGSKNVVVSNDSETLPEFIGTDLRMESDLMTITLANGYPGYQEEVYTNIQNKGTVPTKFQVTLAAGEVIPDWMHFQIVNPTTRAILYDNKTATNGLNGLQIEPGECVCVKIIERILQEAPQNDSINFTMQLKGIQWNEYNFTPLPSAITADTASAQS